VAAVLGCGTSGDDSRGGDGVCRGGRRYECSFEGNVKGAGLKQKQAGATLRSRTAGSQDESRCGAVHKCNGNGQIKGNIKIESNGKIECNVRTDGDCCPVPQSGTGRYRFKGKDQFNYNVKGARLKCESRRPLHKATATSKAPA
jgi:hypothetical protein